MTLFPIDQVRGSHLVERKTFSLTDSDLVSIEIAMTAYDGALNGARLVNVAGRPAYILLGENGPQMLDARQGHAWDGLGETRYSQCGERELSRGRANWLLVTKLTEAPKDYSGKLPVWQASFDDKAKTRLYIDPDTGEVHSVEHVSGGSLIWRGSSTLWMSLVRIISIAGGYDWPAGPRSYSR